MSEEEFKAQKLLMEQRFWPMLWGRLKVLVAKIIGVKCLVFVVATVLVLTTRAIDGWIWFASATLLVGARTFEKYIEKR